MGKFVHWRLPGPVRRWMVQTFARVYQINTKEAELPLEQYPTVGEFFVRRLASSARPLGGEGLLHPADSVVNQAGRITDDRLIQAKGRDYALGDFLGQAATASTYRNGAFMTYYLCPTDYHRVHSPVDGYIKRVSYIPGNLWPVNSWSVETIQDLFVVNERVIVEIESAYGMVAVVFVGATNVGEISLSFWPEFRSNSKNRERLGRSFNREVMTSKGDELGIFHMGSTVVMILSQEVLNNAPALLPAIERLPGRQVRVRSNLTSTVSSNPLTHSNGAHP